MNNQDLRVVKTLSSIESAFLTLLEQNLTNDMKLRAIFGSFSILQNEYRGNYIEQIRKLIADMIQGLFPQNNN